MATEEQWSGFWDWASGTPSGTIDLSPLDHANGTDPGLMPDWADWVDSAVSAVDPFGILSGQAPAAGGSSTTQGAISNAAGQFGKSFGQLAGITLLVGVAYLIFKAEAG